MTEVLMNALCRFCLSKEKGLQPIFSPNTTILRKIGDIIQFEVKNEEGLPTNICQHCLFQLNSAHRFKLRCSRTEAKLRAFVTQKIEVGGTLDLCPSDDSDSDTEFDLPICEVVYTEPQDNNSESKHLLGNDSKHLIHLPSCTPENDHLPVLSQSNRDHCSRHTVSSESTHKKENKGNVMDNNILVKEEPHSDLENSGSRCVKEEVDDKIDSESNNGHEESCNEQDEKPAAKDNVKPAVTSKNKNIHRTQKLHVSQKKKESKNLLVICEICGKLFKKNHLYYHRKLHTAERQHECSICHKTFKMMTHLKRHVRLHDGEKSFLCSYCGKSFIDSSNLRNHVRNHKQERNYTCVTCGKSFARAETLTKHLRSHTGEKPYTCEVCARLFPRKDSLIRHMKSHRGERPHKCDSCDRCFTQSYDLKLHRRKHAARQI